MDDKQKINCTVETCRYNIFDNNECTLKQIMVSPIPDCNTKTPDESMCSSYEYDKNS